MCSSVLIMVPILPSFPLFPPSFLITRFLRSSSSAVTPGATGGQAAGASGGSGRRPLASQREEEAADHSLSAVSAVSAASVDPEEAAMDESVDQRTDRIQQLKKVLSSEKRRVERMRRKEEKRSKLEADRQEEQELEQQIAALRNAASTAEAGGAAGAAVNGSMDEPPPPYSPNDPVDQKQQQQQQQQGGDESRVGMGEAKRGGAGMNGLSVASVAYSDSFISESKSMMRGATTPGEASTGGTRRGMHVSNDRSSPKALSAHAEQQRQQGGRTPDRIFDEDENLPEVTALEPQESLEEIDSDVVEDSMQDFDHVEFAEESIGTPAGTPAGTPVGTPKGASIGGTGETDSNAQSPLNARRPAALGQAVNNSGGVSGLSALKLKSPLADRLAPLTPGTPGTPGSVASVASMMSVPESIASAAYSDSFMPEDSSTAESPFPTTTTGQPATDQAQNGAGGVGGAAGTASPEAKGGTDIVVGSTVQVTGGKYNGQVGAVISVAAQSCRLDIGGQQTGNVKTEQLALVGGGTGGGAAGFDEEDEDAVSVATDIGMLWWRKERKSEGTVFNFTYSKYAQYAHIVLPVPVLSCLHYTFPSFSSFSSLFFPMFTSCVHLYTHVSPTHVSHIFSHPCIQSRRRAGTTTRTNSV